MQNNIKKKYEKKVQEEKEEEEKSGGGGRISKRKRIELNLTHDPHAKVQAHERCY